VNRSVLAKYSLVLLAGALSFALLYLLALSVISIWFGIVQMDRSGFWLPMVAGIVGVFFFTALFSALVFRFIDKFRRSGAASPFSSDPFSSEQN